MKLNSNDFFVLLIVIVFMWLKKQQRDETTYIPPVKPTAMDNFQTNLEAEYQTPWDTAPTSP